MDATQDKQRAENLERVIAKNLQYLDTVAEDLMTACLGARSLQEVPPAVIESILKDHRSMRTRLEEIDSVRAFLLKRYNRRIPEDASRLKLMNELEEKIAELSGRLQQGPAPAAGASAPSPSERWLRIDDNSLAFTINARLLDELEYEPPVPGGGPSKRQVQTSGRSFTLFSIRGPASALDDLYARFALRQHDIIERFSATEIRGVLTHLRRTTTDDITHIFKRLLASRFPDVKCILVGLNAPDQLNDIFLKYLERMSEEMRPGELRTIDITKHG